MSGGFLVPGLGLEHPTALGQGLSRKQQQVPASWSSGGDAWLHLPTYVARP